MKAMVYHEYGAPDDVLGLQDIDKPVVHDEGVLVRVEAAAVDPGSWHYLIGTPYIVRTTAGLFKPRRKILGRAVAGRVEAVGNDVTEFEPGDEVFGEIIGGAFAEYVSVSEDVLALKPTNLTFEQAAAVPLGAITALQGLRDKGQIQPDHKVLINGASGGVGTFAVQIAKSYGADVTGVCSTRNVDMVLSIGADHVIDYTQEDFTQGGQRYDLILDLVGSRSMSDLRRALTPKGTLVLSSGPPSPVIRRLITALVVSPFVSQKMVPLAEKPTKKDLVVLKELIEAGKVTPVIDRRYELSEVPQALRYLGEGHAQGKVVITVEQNTN